MAENEAVENKIEDFEFETEYLESDFDCDDTPAPDDDDDEDYESEGLDDSDDGYRKVKSRKGQYPCPHCSYSCDNKTGLLNHVRTHMKIIKYNCLTCNEEFETNDELVAHKEIHADGSQSYMCKKCKLAFTDLCDWLIHKTTHTNQSLFKCDECHKYFKNKNVYRTHLYVHYDKKIECDVCGQFFKTPVLYKSHMNLHTAAYECCECGRVFKDAKCLSNHMITHTGVKLFQCLHCGLGLNDKAQLRNHTETHYDIQPYRCEKCNGRYKKQAFLKSHSCPADPKAKKFICEVCDKKLANKVSLTKHMLLHSEDRPYACEQCDGTFVSHQSLQTHIIYKHSKETPYKCSLCEWSFKMKTGLNRHMKVHQ